MLEVEGFDVLVGVLDCVGSSAVVKAGCEDIIDEAEVEMLLGFVDTVTERVLGIPLLEIELEGLPP